MKSSENKAKIRKQSKQDEIKRQMQKYVRIKKSSPQMRKNKEKKAQIRQTKMLYKEEKYSQR